MGATVFNLQIKITPLDLRKIILWCDIFHTTCLYLCLIGWRFGIGVKIQHAHSVT